MAPRIGTWTAHEDKILVQAVESYKAQHQKQDEPHVVVPSESSKEFWEIKEHVLVSERILLQSLGFDLSVEHPYRRARHPPVRADPGP